MKFAKSLLVSAALLASIGAQAQVVGALGGGYGTFLSLSSAGLSGGSVATLSGGTVYTADQPFADIPAGGVFGGSFLAAGPTSGNTATLSFTAPVDYISFLWGSPDTYNLLTITSSFGAQTFSTATFAAQGTPFASTTGNQAYSQYVQFAGAGITSLSFTNSPTTDAFESANYSITPVPEPETYALMLAGLGAMAFVARRRKNG